MERLFKEGFKTHVCAIAEDDDFNSDKKTENKIYKYFRYGNKNHIKGRINIKKTTDQNKTSKIARINGSYNIEWKPLQAADGEEKRREYYVLKINPEKKKITNDF